MSDSAVILTCSRDSVVLKLDWEIGTQSRYAADGYIWLSSSWSVGGRDLETSVVVQMFKRPRRVHVCFDIGGG